MAIWAACTLGMVSCRRSGIDAEQGHHGGRGLDELADRDAPLADVSGERRDHDHVETAFSASASCARDLGERGAGDQDVVRGGLRLGPRLVGHGLRDQAALQERVVALRGGLRQRVLRFGQLEVGICALHRGARFVEPQVGVDRLDANQHRALRHVLADVDRGRHDPSGALGGDVGGFVRLEAARGLDDDRFVDALHRRDRDRGRRPGFGGGVAVSVPLQPAVKRGRHATQAASAAGPMRTNSLLTEEELPRHCRTPASRQSFRRGQISNVH